MEESERTLEMFWNNHFIRLNKCLDLRKFEQRFKDVRIQLIGVYARLEQINDDTIGNVDEYDAFIHDLQLLNDQSKVRNEKTTFVVRLLMNLIKYELFDASFWKFETTTKESVAN